MVHSNLQGKEPFPKQRGCGGRSSPPLSTSPNPTVIAPASASEWDEYGLGSYPVEIENVDVVCAQLLQRRLEGDGHRLDVVSDEVDLLDNSGVRALVVRRVLQQSQTLARVYRG